ncbi:MAG: PspA/IM30 family protein [Candidatus Poribacteria bacterium]|nr:PspA/IM30 family protein [Candidatus Poribacteria bacterium]
MLSFTNNNTIPSYKRFIEIDGKIFKLAERRLGAFLLDVVVLCIVSLLCTLLIVICIKNIEEWVESDFIGGEANFGYAIGCGDFVESVYVWIGENVLDVDVAERDNYYVYGFWMQFKIAVFTNMPFIFPFILPVWIFALFSESSIGMDWLSLHVLNLKDIKSRNVFLIIGNERKRVGDKFPKKVVVEWNSNMPEIFIDTPEKIAMDELKARRAVAKEQIKTSIAELNTRLSVAKEQVETSIADEKKFEKDYADAIAQAEAFDKEATIAVREGRDEAAREALEKRNDYQRIADRNKTRYEQQKEVVKHHTTLLETLELRTAEIQRKLDIVVAEHTNVDAETHLVDIHKEIEAFDALKMRLFGVKSRDTDMVSDTAVEIAGKIFKLAPRMTQLYVFFMDFMIDLIKWFLLTFLLSLPAAFVAGVESSGGYYAFTIVGICLFFYFCAREPKRLSYIQVLNLENGEPCTTGIGCFIRRLSGLLQPLDLLWLMGEKRQRLGDKFARTVVVKREPYLKQTEDETESPEEVLSHAITEMKQHLSAARQKVEAAFEVQEQLQAAYEWAVSKAEQQEANAITAREMGREDTISEARQKRDAYQFLAKKYQTQFEEQQQVVKTLRNLLTHFEDKILEAEGQREVVAAEQRNVDIEAQLRDLLEEIQQKSEQVERVEEMEQEAMAAANLAKASAELDVGFQDEKKGVEFSRYAEEASIDQDFDRLKEK